MIILSKFKRLPTLCNITCFKISDLTKHINKWWKNILIQFFNTYSAASFETYKLLTQPNNVKNLSISKISIHTHFNKSKRISMFLKSRSIFC